MKLNSINLLELINRNIWNISTNYIRSFKLILLFINLFHYFSNHFTPVQLKILSTGGDFHQVVNISTARWHSNFWRHVIPAHFSCSSINRLRLTAVINLIIWLNSSTLKVLMVIIVKQFQHTSTGNGPHLARFFKIKVGDIEFTLMAGKIRSLIIGKWHKSKSEFSRS